MPKFTPGPWVIDPHQTPESPLSIFDGPNCGTLIATVDANEDGLQECEANARLIAAAPEMYRLLQLTIAFPDHEVEAMTLVKEIKQLLAAVEGTK